jgi:hypothetical protein
MRGVKQGLRAVHRECGARAPLSPLPHSPSKTGVNALSLGEGGEPPKAVSRERVL